MNSKERREYIIKLVKENKIATQDEIRQRLIDDGIEVNQTTVSRDIAKIGIYKITRDGSSFYFYNDREIKSETDFVEIIKNAFRGKVIGVFRVSFQLVLKTEPGLASNIAYYIDNCEFKSILGTIAGDDTIFVTCVNEEASEFLLKKYEDMIKEE